MDTVIEAKLDGQEAGRLGLSSSLNTHPYKSPEWEAWFEGWAKCTVQRAILVIARQNKVCRYGKPECDCGGRGLCLDVA